MKKLEEYTYQELYNIANPNFDYIKNVNYTPKFDNLDLNKVVFNQKDNVLFQMKDNQEKYIKNQDKYIENQQKYIETLEITNSLLKQDNEQLVELNKKQEQQIKEMKVSSSKERHRFWWTFGITTLITITIGILGIIF